MKLNKTLVPALCAIVLFTVYGFYLAYYNEFLLNADGAYVYLQMQEFFRGNHFDLLHKGYQYCGLFEHFFSALIGFILPTSFAIVIGISLYYIIGFFILKKYVCNDDKSPYLFLLLLLIPTPNVFFQSYAALGGHTYTVFQFFVALAILSSRHSDQQTGKMYSLGTYLLLGLSSGIALYTYRLSLLVILPSFLVLLGNDIKQLTVLISSRDITTPNNKQNFLKNIKNIFQKVFTLLLAMYVGYLPATLSLFFYPGDHLYKSPSNLLFSFPHIVDRANKLLEVLSHIFTPFWTHTIVSPSAGVVYHHNNYPINEVLTHNSTMGLFIGVGIAVLFFALAANRLIIEKKSDNFTWFLILISCAFIAGYIFRKLEISREHESRYLLVLYFSFVIGIFAWLPKKIASLWAAGLIILALVSHGVIIKTNLNYIATRQVTKEEIWNSIKRLQPDIIAGTYWEVWPLAAFLKKNLVLSIHKHKFYFNYHKFLDNKMVIVTPKEYKLNFKTDILPFIGLNRERRFAKATTGSFAIYIEDRLINNQNDKQKLTEPALD